MTRSPFYKWAKETYNIDVKGTSRSIQWRYYEEWFEDHYKTKLKLL